jgi:hypothetical protein
MLDGCFTDVISAACYGDLDKSEKSEITRCNPGHGWYVLVNVKVVVAILLMVGVPVCAQAQSVQRVSKADAQRVVEIISSDKAKTQAYCDIQDLGEQMERAYEERNIKLVDELLQKIDTMGKTLVPEYAALIDRLELLDPEKDKLGAEIMFELTALNRLCAR